MLERDRTTRSFVCRHLASLFAASCAVLYTGVVAMAQEGVPQTGNYPQSVGPWEVILYEHPHYAGTWIRYTVQPGMRQRLVPQIDPALESYSCRRGCRRRLSPTSPESAGERGNRILSVGTSVRHVRPVFRDCDGPGH